MNKIKKYLLNLWYGLPFGLKAAGDEIMGAGDADQVGTEINQQVSDQRVAKHLLKGEITQEVEELRYRNYKVAGEAENFEYLGNGVAVKKENGKKTALKDRYKFSQENGLMVSTVLEELNRVNDYGVEKYRLEIGYNSLTRFKLEQFVTIIDVDIDVRKETNPSVIETRLHFEKQPDPYNPKARPFLNELVKLKDVKTQYEIERNEMASSIDNMSFITYNATNEINFTNYAFVDGAKFKSFEETEHEYLVTFEWSGYVRIPLNLEGKYYSKTMDEKYKNNERKEVAPEMVNVERKAYCSVCGAEMSVYDADIQRADGREPVCKNCLEKALNSK
jgi:hypothetical protein